MASRLKKAIGEKLREFRHKRYYTQEYLAELVELDIKQIGRIERGESYLKPENLEKFCKVLKVHPKDFYDFHGKMKKTKYRNAFKWHIRKNHHKQAY